MAETYDTTPDRDDRVLMQLGGKTTTITRKQFVEGFLNDDRLQQDGEGVGVLDIDNLAGMKPDGTNVSMDAGEAEAFRDAIGVTGLVDAKLETDGSNVAMDAGEATAFRTAIGVDDALGDATGPLTRTFETRALASAAAIDAAVTTLVVNRYSATHPSAPAQYKEVADSGTVEAWQFETNAGARRWQLVPDARGINALALGAMADGAVVTRYPWVVTGTDDRAAVQAAIDFATYFCKCLVYAPGGRYRINGPLHAGYGDIRTATHFYGDGRGYRAESLFAGTSFICDFSEGMGINIQGARGTRVGKMAFLSKNLGWLEDNNMTGLVAADIDDRDIANWVLAGLGTTRYAPHAGVCVDGYAGVAPATTYPTVTYPAWTGIGATQYGKLNSSDVLFDDVYIGGFVVAGAIQPADTDSNGDFIRWQYGLIEGCAYGISAGNTQGRNFGWDNVSASLLHTGFATQTHGKQTGKIQGLVKNSHLGNIINLLNCPSATFAGPLSFEDCYSEVLWSLGAWGSTAASAGAPLSFEGCKLNFSAQTVERGIPPYLLNSAIPSPVSFEDCTIDNIYSVAFFSGVARDYAFKNCNIAPVQARTETYEKLAHNALAGGIVLTPSAIVPIPQQFQVRPQATYNIETGANFGAALRGEVCTTQRAIGPCVWASEATPSLQPGYSAKLPRFWNGSVDKATLSACTLTGRELSITFASRTEQAYAMNGPLPGDVIIDAVSGSVFFVRSRTTTTVLAVLQNNFRYLASVYTYTNAFVTGSGTFYFCNSRIFTPSQFLQGDTATGTAIITNAGNAQATSTFIEDQIKVDDWLYVNPEIDNTYTEANAKVTARDNTAKTITLTGNGAQALTKKPFPFWVRQPPANV